MVDSEELDDGPRGPRRLPAGKVEAREMFDSEEIADLLLLRDLGRVVLVDDLALAPLPATSSSQAWDMPLAFPLPFPVSFPCPCSMAHARPTPALGSEQNCCQ